MEIAIRPKIRAVVAARSMVVGRGARGSSLECDKTASSKRKYLGEKSGQVCYTLCACRLSSIYNVAVATISIVDERDEVASFSINSQFDIAMHAMISGITPCFSSQDLYNMRIMIRAISVSYMGFFA